MEPRETMDQFAAMLNADDLPRFEAAMHDLIGDRLLFLWPNGLVLEIDPTIGELPALDEEERAAILAGPDESGCPPVDVYVPGCDEDPRDVEDPPGVRIHRGPPLHPDDVTVLHGIPTTSISRTLIDCAEFLGPEDLRDAFRRAQAQDLLDRDALLAARGRVEWRPSLALFDEVMAEFID